MIYGIYLIKNYFFNIMSQLRPAPTTSLAYESKPSIFMLMSQNQAYWSSWINTKHTRACVPETVSSYYLRFPARVKIPLMMLSQLCMTSSVTI